MYSDQKGRIAIALAFNKAVADGQLKVNTQKMSDHLYKNGCTYLAKVYFRMLLKETLHIPSGSAFRDTQDLSFSFLSQQGPVVLSRDHHDVSGTDSPFRETANIYDGSAYCADMAVQNAIGDSFRGATWVALHNGGGVGW